MTTPAQSFKLPAKSGELLLDFGEVLTQARNLFLHGAKARGDGIFADPHGRSRGRHIGYRRFAGEKMHVAGFFRAGLARKNSGQGWFALGEPVQGGDDIVESLEVIQAIGAAAQFAGSLRSA